VRSAFVVVVKKPPKVTTSDWSGAHAVTILSRRKRPQELNKSGHMLRRLCVRRRIVAHSTTPRVKRARIDTRAERQRREKHRCAQQQPTKAVLVVGCSTTNEDLPVPDVQTQSPSLSTTNSNETVGRRWGSPTTSSWNAPFFPCRPISTPAATAPTRGPGCWGPDQRTRPSFGDRLFAGSTRRRVVSTTTPTRHTTRCGPQSASAAAAIGVGSTSRAHLSFFSRDGLGRDVSVVSSLPEEDFSEQRIRWRSSVRAADVCHQRSASASIAGLVERDKW
jgi:hypothetical protein